MNATLLKKSKRLLDTLLNLIYPNSCIVCKKQMGQNLRLLCEPCMESIKIADPPCCFNCGKHLDKAWSCTVYDGVMKKCIHLFKYKQRPGLINVFRELMLEFSLENPFLENIDLIVPVPLHPTKLRHRTYNQASLVAGELSKVFSIPLEEANFKKVKNTRPQTSLDKKKRLKNVSASFKVKKKAPFNKKRILLVDDVFTTGATLNECAGALREAGAKFVSAFTLARGA